MRIISEQLLVQFNFHRPSVPSRVAAEVRTIKSKVVPAVCNGDVFFAQNYLTGATELPSRSCPIAFTLLVFYRRRE